MALNYRRYDKCTRTKKLLLILGALLGTRLTNHTGSGPMSSTDSRHEKFKELAEARVRKTAKSIQLIGNLGNRSNYSYTDADVRKIFSYLDKALKEARRKFEASASDAASEGFKL